MPFFAPMPWEADKFHSQPGMAEKNLTLDWYPIGTGPYMLTENNPNARLVLERNPNFREERYPCEGEAENAKEGLIRDCGQLLPFIDKVVFTREKEQMPCRNKFLQGIVLTTSVATSSMYMGFNWLDPLVGGADPKTAENARKLRQAISLAIDREAFISIFQNGRGVAARGPIPPGIFGHREGASGINPCMYDWVDGHPRRKPIAEAKRLLAEAGWPNGRDAKTGEPLVINLDTTATGVGAKALIDWLNKQFAGIDTQLVVRSSDYNRFQEKVRKGALQLFCFGWNADYPDPENFLFLLHGKQGKVKNSGENAAN